MADQRFVAASPLPGFGLTFGFTTFFLSAVILLPLGALVIRALGIPPSDLIELPAGRTRRRVVPAFLRRRRTRGRDQCGVRLHRRLVTRPLRFPGTPAARHHDRPALRVADGGLRHCARDRVLSTGWLGQKLALAGVQVAYTWLGVVVALVLIGLPFVVRSVQPALIEVGKELEDAAESLGAGGFHVFRRVILPTILPALATGFTLAFARGIGEYGSVVFISGNLPLKTEITPLLIVIKLEQYDYAGAAALGFFMLAMSFVMLFAINLVQGWGQRRMGIGATR